VLSILLAVAGLALAEAANRRVRAVAGR